MITVRIIKNWDKPDILRQTPGTSGVWENIKFTFEPIFEPDYVIVLNYSPKEIKVFVPYENIWCVLQEPPNEYFKYWHQADKVFHCVFIQDPTLYGLRYIHSQPALPWHVDKSYDSLVKCSIPDKPLQLSFITSRKTSYVGQKQRVKFLERLKERIEFDLFGYGFSPIKDKWNGLAPYRYSLVVENFSGLDYWSEKLADCFLSWTMPIYYGCTNITDYFPKEALIQIDINDPNVVDYIQKVIKSDLWKKHRKAIEYARKLILDKYQFFPYFAKYVHNWEKKYKTRKRKKEYIVISEENTLMRRFNLKIRQLFDSFI